MNESRLATIEQIAEFMAGTASVVFSIPSDESRLRAFVATVLKRFRYFGLAKGSRGVLFGYSEVLLWQLRALTVLLALLSGWYAYSLLRHRAQLAHMALYDALTDLPNRRLIEDRIQRAIMRQHRSSQSIAAVLLFDLNGFKPVNDRHGHKAGDHVLQQVAIRVGSVLRSSDTVGRWGGDEFVVALQDVTRQTLPEIVERISQAVATPISYGLETLVIGASIGIAICPDDGDIPSQLIRLADQRMYEHKSRRCPKLVRVA